MTDAVAHSACDAFGDAWKTLLDRYTWTLYAHLTFRGMPTLSYAESRFKAWIHRLNRQLYGQHYFKHHRGVRWVRGEELQIRGVIHYHALIGHGPAPSDFRRRLTPEHAMYAWTKLAGDAKVAIYNPSKHGIEYLVKKYGPANGRIILSDNM